MVSGVVHADDGTPLEHVSIKATDGKKVLATTQSDAKGLFTIKLPATAVELSAQLLGYKAAVLKVSESRTTYHFVLNEQAQTVAHGAGATIDIAAQTLLIKRVGFSKRKFVV